MSEEVVTGDQLRAVLDAYSPQDWKPHARGIVFLGNTSEEQGWVFAALRKWARDGGFPIRIPHHSVSAAGLAAPRRSITPPHVTSSELDLAVGGILVLDDFADFDDHGLYNVAKRVVREKLPGVVVVGLEHLRDGVDPDDFMGRVRKNAEALGLEIVTIDEFEDVATLPSRTDVATALDAINLHRRRLGMGALDPAAAGWTDQDVLLEAERITRLSNPLALAPRDPVLAEMSADLEMALLEQDLRTVDDVLTSARDFYGADASETRALHVLVRSYGVLANPDFPDAAAAALAAKLPRRQRDRLWKLHGAYAPTMFEKLTSVPGAAVETPMGVHVVPDGRALLFRVEGFDYLTFQDAPPAESWSFVTLGSRRRDRVEHLSDYLSVLERVDAIVREQVDRPELHRVQRVPVISPERVRRRNPSVAELKRRLMP